jgi:hypothetical protein
MMHFTWEVILQHQSAVLVSFAIAVAMALFCYKSCKKFISFVTGYKLDRIRTILLAAMCLSLVLIFQMRGIIMSFFILSTLRGAWIIDYIFEAIDRTESPSA